LAWFTRDAGLHEASAIQFRESGVTHERTVSGVDVGADALGLRFKERPFGGFLEHWQNTGQ